MQWFGKAVGGIIGLVAAGPIGSVLGVLLGHQLDAGSVKLRRSPIWRSRCASRSPSG